MACHFAEDIRGGVLRPHRVVSAGDDDVLRAGPGALDHPGSVTEVLGR
ncbi:MAG: hypothetical protein L0H64_12765 [Pseudonocardia sp.]|nr:hypothetical protein [Pseudonocardia sp.]